jgi:hypothetical protein
MEHLIFSIKGAAVDEHGVFSGPLAVFSNVDRQNEVIVPGAARKSISENPTVPLLQSHNAARQIGVLHLSENAHGVQARGHLNLDVPDGVAAYKTLLFNKAHGLRSGMSVGFQTLKDTMKAGIRHLTEIRIHEGSLVAIPANPLAGVDAVKHFGSTEITEMLAEWDRKVKAAVGPPLGPEMQLMLDRFKRRLEAI